MRVLKLKKLTIVNPQNAPMVLVLPNYLTPEVAAKAINHYEQTS